MKSTEDSVRWLRKSSYQSDFVHGCPPKVDSPDLNAQAIDAPQGCPPKVDSPDVDAQAIDAPQGCPPKVD